MLKSNQKLGGDSLVIPEKPMPPEPQPSLTVVLCFCVVVEDFDWWLASRPGFLGGVTSSLSSNTKILMSLLLVTLLRQS